MNKLLLIALLTVMPVVTRSQVSMHDVVRKMPTTQAPYLTENNLLDLVDFKEAGMKAEVHNALEGVSELLTLTDRYADLQLNAAHRMELLLLDVTEPVDSCQQLVCVVNTYGEDVRESIIDFYSLSWRQLDASRYVSSLPAGMFTATLDEQSQQLVVTPSNYLDRPANEDQQSVTYLPIYLKWINNIFK